MKVVCCSGAEKHYYDADIYKKCPHCGAEIKEEKIKVFDSGLDSTKDEKDDRKKSGWGSIWGKSKNDYNFKKKKKEDEKKHPKTESLFGKESDEYEFVLENELEKDEPIIKEESEKDESIIKEEQEKDGPTEKEETVENGESSSSLQTIVSNIQGTEPKTVGYWGTQKSEPMIGWLVCIRGPEQGEFYPLYAGKNTVGRELGMTVQIAGDNEISRHHTVIKYEPKSRKIKVLPGEGNGLVYLGDEDLDLPTELKDRDIITLGKSKLMLIALCGSDFTWDDWIKETEN